MNLVEQALDAALPKRAMDFFVVFSRFECALKRSGKYAIGDETRVDPDWDCSARDLAPSFMTEVIGRGVASDLVAGPRRNRSSLPMALWGGETWGR
jgi:hypothetical protein